MQGSSCVPELGQLWHSGSPLDVLSEHPVISRRGKISLTFSSQGSSIVFGNHSLCCVTCRNIFSLSELSYFKVFVSA